MKRQTTSLAVLSLALGGCLPMEQAPLVYSSKNQFGVTVSAGTPDSPGLDVNIGYKALDSAFVPVAVAKHCSSKSRTECEGSMYGIQTVLGSNSVTGETTVDAQNIERTRSDIALANAERARKQNELGAANSSLERLQTKAAKEAELATLRNPSIDAATQMPRVLTSAEQDRMNQLQQEVAQLSALDERTLQARTNTLKAEVSGIDQRLGQLSSQLERQIAQRNEQTGDLKSDALSLFGSFNGSAAGDSGGARLGLGKIFATGVAAQHMAQGVSDAASPTSRAVCLDRARSFLEVVPAAEQAAVRDRLLSGCGISE